MLSMNAIFELTPDATDFFPLHGWIEGATGVRLLRLPILRVFQHSHPHYSRFTTQGLGGMWLQTRSPYRAIRQLGVALRDLHAELRVLLELADEDWFDEEASDSRNRALTRQNEGNERCEVLLISVFILLRRLADDLTDSLRPVLFEHWKSAPSQLKKMISLAESGGLHALKPYCDADDLSSIVLTDTTWLQKLRKKDGIRDTLVHRPHILSVGSQGTKPNDTENYAWHIIANMMVWDPNGVRSTSLFPLLLECIAGACTFMTSISKLIGGMNSFDRGDMVVLTGSDNDIVGFWPPIRGVQHEFPLRT